MSVGSCCVLVYRLAYVYECFIGKEFSYNENSICQYILSTSVRKKLSIGGKVAVSSTSISQYRCPS